MRTDCQVSQNGVEWEKENLRMQENEKDRKSTKDQPQWEFYAKTKSFGESTQNVMGSKERIFYQGEIMRLSQELEHEKSLVQKFRKIETEFEKCMRICLDQEQEINQLKHDLMLEAEKSER